MISTFPLRFLVSRVPVTSSCLFSNEATSSNSLADKKNDEIQKASGKSKVLEKAKVGIFGSSTVPINTNFPNPKGVVGYDPDFSAKELLAELPKTRRTQGALLAGELKEAFQNISIEKPELLEDIGFVRHNEARVEYRFDTQERLDLWKTGCDSDWKEGFSKCTLTNSDHGSAIFSGNISTRVLKDGRVERAGWASMKLEDRKSFNRKKFFSKWRNFSHLLLKVRGDGRSYKLMLHSPLSMDFTWGDSFSHPLHTHGGPYWQYERIPFSKFFHTVAGRIQDRQYRVNLEDTSSLGIVLMDRIDGDFRLEIDYIGVYNDTTHVEDFAYETYTLPVFNTHGF
uniref:CIA30 domain-containing protein n=1 Tax=Caenorhabditis japonica TaxID=281687 RepID=A0A8R1HPW2_CAEJA